MQSLLLMAYDFTLLGEIALYKSLTLTRSWCGVGGFKLTLDAGAPGEKLLARDTLLCFPGDPARTLLCEKITRTRDKTTVDGWQLKGLVKRRVCVPPLNGGDDPYRSFGYDRFTGDGESALLHYAANNLTACEAESRRFPALKLAENQHRGLALPWQARFDALEDKLSDIGEAAGLGWDIRPDFANRRYVFEVLEGADRTAGAARATLGERMGNVTDTTYTDDALRAVSTCYAGGAGEDEQRLILAAGTDAAGLLRREAWQDASGVSDTDLLRMAAERKLLAPAQTLTAELLDSGLCRYGRDYDVGDLVTLRADAYEAQPRLVAMTETYEGGARKLKATFGDAPASTAAAVLAGLKRSVIG